MNRLIATTTALGLVASTAMGADFTVTSPDIANGHLAMAQFANGFGCTGDNISPALEWTNAPEGTKSFAVSIFDKDAPTGSGLWHWVVVDIPANATGLKSGAGTDPALLPSGAQIMTNDIGMKIYAGACPPVGEEHEYLITVKALGVDKLPVDPTATAAMVGLYGNMNALGTATMIAKGKR